MNGGVIQLPGDPLNHTPSSTPAIQGFPMPRVDVAPRFSADTLVASAARTTTSNSGPIYGWGAASSLRLRIAVTAVSGISPTLDVVVEDTLDGTNWHTIATFAQKTATGTEAVNVTSPFTDQLRVRWTVGGTTPSFTFSVLAYSK